LRSFTVRAKSFESAQSLFNALADFAPHLSGSKAEGYFVSVDPVGDRQVIAVLEAIQQYVEERQDPANVNLDGRSYVVHPE
jgi:hypothetical protein